MVGLRVMTWNVENLFRPEDTGGPPRGRYADKLGAIAAVIDQEAPDVIALQEVGSPEALDDLLVRVGGDWQVRTAAGDARGIRVAFASRLPIVADRQIRDRPPGLRAVQGRDPVFDDPATPEDESLVLAMKRPALEIDVRTDVGALVTLITAHFKSKLISYPSDRVLRPHSSTWAPADEGERARYAAYALFQRTAEAVTLRCRLNEVLAGQGGHRRVVFMGDLNDEPHAATTQILQGPTGSELPVGEDGEVPHPVPGGSGFARPDGGDGDRMWNLAALIPKQERATRVYRGRPEVIDHVFVSRALVSPGELPTVKTVAVARSLPSVTDVATERTGAAGSDHAAVVADLTS